MADWKICVVCGTAYRREDTLGAGAHCCSYGCREKSMEYMKNKAPKEAYQLEPSDDIYADEVPVINFGDEGEVRHPSHYDVFPDKEAIEIIARSMTLSEFYGYCYGCCLKYRLRAGNKGDAMTDLRKANEYIKLYDDWAQMTRDFKG